MKRIELIGKRFGKLVVLEDVGGDRYRCICDCGEYKTTSRLCLMKGKTRSCGCLKTGNLEGKKFHRWVVIKLSHRHNGHVYWKCQCECGNIGYVSTNNLNSGQSKSCGCLQLDTITKHGKSRTNLYKVWDSMKYRCYSKSCHAYSSYGGRGITVCDEWLDDFHNFYKWAIQSGYKKGLSIDRIDNDREYSPVNCRWATTNQQQNNTRRTVNLTYNGVTQSLSKWSEETGIHKSTLSYRLKAGWSIEDVLNREPRKRSLKR